MNNYSRFLNINESDISFFKSCFNSEEKKYQKKDIIMRFNERSETVGLIEKGLAYLVNVNHDGEESIMDYYQQGDIFAKEFCSDIDVNLCYVIAKTECTINFFDYNKILNYGNDDCQKHAKLINKIFLLSIRKAQAHVEVLSQRTIRNKLIAYFEYIKHQTNSDDIKIPLPLSDLADYLSVDRSAMMRELKKMNDDKTIISKGRKITVATNK